MIFIGIKPRIERVWSSGIKWNLSSILSTHIFFSPVSSCLVTVYGQPRGLLDVEMKNLASAAIVASSSNRFSRAAASCKRAARAAVMHGVCVGL